MTVKRKKIEKLGNRMNKVKDQISVLEIKLQKWQVLQKKKAEIIQGGKYNNINRRKCNWEKNQNPQKGKRSLSTNEYERKTLYLATLW